MIVLMRVTRSGEVTLTDGWYKIRATLDFHLTKLVTSQKIGVGEPCRWLWSDPSSNWLRFYDGFTVCGFTVCTCPGQKLRICNAELAGYEDACSPLEQPESGRLK